MKKKIFPLDRLRSIFTKEKNKGKKIVHCHGVFDLLHIGHIKHFEEFFYFLSMRIFAV